MSSLTLYAELKSILKIVSLYITAKNGIFTSDLLLTKSEVSIVLLNKILVVKTISDIHGLKN